MKKPSITILSQWWNHCIEHMAECDDPNCEQYWAFARFLDEHGLEITSADLADVRSRVAKRQAVKEPA